MSGPKGFFSRPAAHYLYSAVAVFSAFLLRHAFSGFFGSGLTYITFSPAVMLAATLGGLGAGLFATALAALLAALGILLPLDAPDLVGLGLFCALGIGMSLAARLYHRARERAAGFEMELAVRGEQTRAAAEIERQRQLLAVTLASIGDGVIVTDHAGCVTFLNKEAERLTGWRNEDAAGHPLTTVFHIINEESRQPVESPADKVLSQGTAVGLANHTLLIAKDGREIPIDDSGAPIRLEDGRVHGVVLVFRDFTQRRAAEDALRLSEQRVRMKLDSILAPEGDLGRLDLADVIDVPALQKLMEHFHHISRIPMAVLDSDGNVLIGIGWQEICTRFHRMHPETCKYCIESDTQLSAGVPPGQFKRYKCKNYMWDVATPIIVNGQHAGNLFMGQFFFEGEPLDRELFRSQARQYGFDEEEYLAALDRVPRLSREAVDSGMAFFMRLAQMISQLSSSNLKLARSLAQRNALTDSLRQSEERLRVTLTSIGDGVMTCDGEGRVTFLNPVAEALTDWKTEDALGQPIQQVFKLINEQTRKPADDIAARVLREGRVIALANHTALVTRDGREIPIEDSAAPITDAAGGVSGVVLVFHDVTEKRRAQASLRESEELNRRIIDSSRDCIKVLDLKGNLLSMSPGGQQLLEIGDIQQYLGASWINFWREEDRLAVRQAIDAALADGTGQFVAYCPGVKGTPKWWDVIVTPILGAAGQPERLLAVSRDITERQRAVNELCQANERLADADQRKDEFLAMLAHELRNPLAPVRNAMAVLRLAGPDEAILQRQRGIIDRQVTHMARLLDDLLDVSRITRGKITLQKQPLVLLDVLAHAAEVVAPLVESRRHKLHLSLPPANLRVEGDLDRLAQVVGNLLTNAAKYTPEGGQIWLEAAGVDGKAVVHVRDNGVGIAPEMLPRVFDLFAQADRSLDRSQGGLGIGLTMVQSLTQMHGGCVEANSRGPGLGSEFTVYLPALPDHAEEAVSLPEQCSLPSGTTNVHRRVLVVDDVVDSAETLADLLRMWGHEVQTAHDGPAAVGTARSFQPEAVLLDIGLPGMNGLEVACRLRAEHDRPMLLVALSGYGQAQDQAASLAAGFDRHLVKPVDLQILEKLLADWS